LLDTWGAETKKTNWAMSKNRLHIGPTENKIIFNTLSVFLKLGVYVSDSQLENKVLNWVVGRGLVKKSTT